MIKRRVYTKEFKIEAVELTERSEKTVNIIGYLKILTGLNYINLLKYK